MLIAISIYNASHQKQHGGAMAEGVKRHGHQVQFIHGDEVWWDADVHVCWSIKRPQIFNWRAATNRPVLVMERGHVGDRMVYTSCGWNGLGRRGFYPKAEDGGERWRRHWAELMQPWRNGGGLYALILGQVSGDAALNRLGAGFEHWARMMTGILLHKKYAVRYRPHPWVRKHDDHFCPEGAEKSYHDALADDLKDAKFCITYNSTAGVECVLAGVPTLTMDEGAMAWPMTTHSIFDPIIRPDREAWAHDLAFTQWSLEEISSGEAWAHLAPLMNA